MALVALGMIVSLFAGRALQLQGFDTDAYAMSADKQMTRTQVLIANRGTITDRFGQVLAASQPAVTIIADPTIIATNGMLAESMSKADREKAAAGPDVIAGLLATHVGGDPAAFKAALTKPDTKYSIVAKRVPSYRYAQLANAMSEAGYVGLFRENDPIRTYPNGTVASNVVGFVNRDSEGAGGLEYALDATLAGTPGKEVYQTSPNGRIPLGTSLVTSAVDGVSYELTIDASLQWMVEQRLAAAVNGFNAVSGMAIVMSVKTGEVLAMANYPSFDANDPGAGKTENLGNRAVTNAYEPGSVQKVLTMAALIDQGLISPDTRVVIPESITSGGKPIRDAFKHKTIKLTARGVVANSSNVGTVLLARTSPKDKLVDYLRAFGLGTKTGIGLPGEASGSVPDASMPDYTRDQISFGQGLSVTAIQEAAAVAAIANGGVYHSPTILRSATGPDGKPVAVPTPTTRRVISESTSAQVLDMMEAVVASKVGVKRFPIEGYRTADKSGTAERINPECGCYQGYVSSFIGVAPAESPQYLVYVVIDRPSNGPIQGSQVAAPAFKDIMRVVLPRYGVLPSVSPAPVKPIEWS